jgi:hypothetical protein
VKGPVVTANLGISASPCRGRDGHSTLRGSGRRDVTAPAAFDQRSHPSFSPASPPECRIRLDESNLMSPI